MIKNTQGFTLVELLVSIIILSIIITTVYYTYRVGFDCYRQAEGKMELYQNARSAMERMAKDLQGIFIPENKNIGRLQGSSNSIEMITSSRQFRPLNKDYGLVKVGYYIDGGLKRMANIPLPSEIKEQEEARDIAPLVNNVRFRYLYYGGWYDSWDSSIQKGLPQAIEIKIDLAEVKLETVVPIFCGLNY